MRMRKSGLGPMIQGTGPAVTSNEVDNGQFNDTTERRRQRTWFHFPQPESGSPMTDGTQAGDQRPAADLTGIRGRRTLGVKRQK